MNNYSFWSKAMKAALKLHNCWIDPSKTIDILCEDELKINEKAAYYVSTNLDENNMTQITTENEQCFLTIWNLFEQLHQPQTASTLVDFYVNIYTLIHRSGGDVQMHLLQLEKQFEKL